MEFEETTGLECIKEDSNIDKRRRRSSKRRQKYKNIVRFKPRRVNNFIQMRVARVPDPAMN